MAVVQLGLKKQFRLVVSEHIMERLGIVLTRPYFLERTSDDSRSELVESTVQASIPVEPDPSVSGIADDAEDDKVLGTAVAAEADFLVTGDSGLLEIREYRGVRIVTAREFLEILDTD